MTDEYNKAIRRIIRGINMDSSEDDEIQLTGDQSQTVQAIENLALAVVESGAVAGDPRLVKAQDLLNSILKRRSSQGSSGSSESGVKLKLPTAPEERLRFLHILNELHLALKLNAGRVQLRELSCLQSRKRTTGSQNSFWLRFLLELTL